MLKNNWFNRLFHATQVAEHQKDATRVTALYARRNEFLKELEAAKTLEELLAFHKRIWNEGYRNANLGPCSYGIFRTEDIETMKPEEVFLGGIWGLYTKPISFWEERKDDLYGANGFGLKPEMKIYGLIFNQYYKHLRSNFNAIVSEAKDLIDEYTELDYEIFYQGPC